mgnify:CR=1 FL=1
MPPRKYTYQPQAKEPPKAAEAKKPAPLPVDPPVAPAPAPVPVPVPVVIDADEDDGPHIPAVVVSRVLHTVSRTGDLVEACRGVVAPGDLTQHLRDNDQLERLEDARRLYAEKLMQEIISIADTQIYMQDGPDDPELLKAWMMMKRDLKARRIDARKYVASQFMPAAKGGVAVNVDARTQTANRNTFLGAVIAEKK